MGIGDDIIDDPLSRFMDEESAREAGIKDPVTGIRSPVDKAQKRQFKNDEIKRKQEVKKRVLAQLMSDDLGREWLYDFLVGCNIEGTPFTLDERTTAYNSGALHIGLLLKADIKKAGIKEYFLMMEEGYEREQLWDDLITDKS